MTVFRGVVPPELEVSMAAMPLVEPVVGIESEAASVASSRPFYVILTLWGARFRYYFLEYCLPSLLSAGNIPALAGKRPVKLVIATLPQDWEAMKATPIFRLLERYAEPVFVEIPPCPPDRSGCQHMGIGHKLMGEMAYRDKAYAVMITPDLMLSDGTLERLDCHARHGIELVLVAAMRFGEEPFFENLRTAGAIADESCAALGKARPISSRTMVHAAINALHSETQRYEWDAPYLVDIPSACWWKVAGGSGIVVHSLSWAPLLLDYGAIKDHDVSALETWTIDGDYVYKNLGDSSRMHIVQDSDEIFIASWSPLAEKSHDLTPSPVFHDPVMGALTKGALLKTAFYSSVFDPLKRRIFFQPVRWHSEPVTEDWPAVERLAQQALRAFVHPPRPPMQWATKHPRSPTASKTAEAARGLLERLHYVAWCAQEAASVTLGRMTVGLITFMHRCQIVGRHGWAARHAIRDGARRLVRGDATEVKRVLKRVYFFTTFLLGEVPRDPDGPRVTNRPRGFIGRLLVSFESWNDNRDVIRCRTRQALAGSRAAASRIYRRCTYTAVWLGGRTPRELEPWVDTDRSPNNG